MFSNVDSLYTVHDTIKHPRKTQKDSVIFAVKDQKSAFNFSNF